MTTRILNVLAVCSIALAAGSVCWYYHEQRAVEQQAAQRAEDYANRPLEVGNRVEVYMEDGRRCLLDDAVDHTATIESIDPKPVLNPDGKESKLANIHWKTKDGGGAGSLTFLHLLKRVKE